VPVDEKTCRSCGRRITWRKKWADDWDQVRFCSTACRRRGVTPEDQALEDAFRELLAARPRTGGVDPADAVARVGARPDAAVSDLEEPARRAARRLVAAGEAEIVQGGRVVDPSSAKGPFTVRRSR
jgi:hypothetical protein